MKTHGAALNALLCETSLMAKNVFVITATNRLMSQKLSTTMQVIKKKQQRKYSESITVYINCAHYNKQVKERQYDYGLTMIEMGRSLRWQMTR